MIVQVGALLTELRINRLVGQIRNRFDRPLQESLVGKRRRRVAYHHLEEAVLCGWQRYVYPRYAGKSRPRQCL